jgi:hypothetical protein
VLDKLNGYIAGGGRLLLGAGSLPKGSAARGRTLQGFSISDPPASAAVLPANTSVSVGGGTVTEALAFEAWGVAHDDDLPDVTVVAQAGDRPLAYQRVLGNGSLVLLACPFGVSAERDPAADPTSQIDVPLLSPFPLTAHARALLDAFLLQSAILLPGDASLTLTQSLVPSSGASDGNITLLAVVSNPTLAELPLKIALAQPRLGSIVSMEEVRTDQALKSAVGYLPDGYEGSDIGTSTADRIAGADTRVFRVVVAPATGAVELLPALTPPAAPACRGAYVPTADARGFISSSPSFFEHFDSVVLDGGAVMAADAGALAEQGRWLALQGLGGSGKGKVVVDVSPAISLYPGLRLINNTADEYAASLAALTELVTSRLPALGATTLIVSLHQPPENNMDAQEAGRQMAETLRQLAATAAGQGIELLLRVSHKNLVSGTLDTVAWLADQGLTLRLALNAGLLLLEGLTDEEVKEVGKQAGVLLIDAPELDLAGDLRSERGCLHKATAEVRERVMRVRGLLCPGGCSDLLEVVDCVSGVNSKGLDTFGHMYEEAVVLEAGMSERRQLYT